MQEVGFPTRNEVEGGRRPVCTSAARKIGVLLARARDGVPQEGLVTLHCAERRKAFGVGVAGGKGPQRRGPEDGGFLAGCRAGEEANAKSDVRFGTPRLAKVKNRLKTSCESVDLRSCCLRSLFGEYSSV